MDSILFYVFGLCFVVFSFTKPIDTKSVQNLFPVSIIHINDFHARFEETNEDAESCQNKEKCIGGYARAVTKIKELQKIRENPIYLNAGDNFQGTLWYSIGRWNVTSEFLNMLNADAITLGNHEFDQGIKDTVLFMESLKSPVVVANIDDTNEQSFQGKYQKSIVIDRYDRKIGIIGVIIETVDQLSNTGNLQFQNESEAIRREATLLQGQGVDIIIVLSHCGLEADYRIAKEIAGYVDIIVGGHSHTFMYTVPEGELAPGPDKVKDNYPAIVETNEGHRVLIVQASAYMKYVGDIVVYFDDHGRIVSWEGAPSYLDSSIVPDADVLKAMQPWKNIVDKKGSEVIGVSEVPLYKKPCRRQECRLGNFIADALIHYYVTQLSVHDNEIWEDSVIALVPDGMMRKTLNAGPITFNDLVTVIPFNNTIDTFELRGDHLKDLFEHAVYGSWRENKFKGQWLTQVAGIKVVYNMNQNLNNRVVSIDIATMNESVPIYKPIDVNKYYTCISASFLANGGDGFDMISKYRRNHKKGLLDIDVVTQYLRDRKSVYTPLEDRIKFISEKL